MHDIPIWFLILSLFLPRLALLIAYCGNQIPLNNIPFWGDFFMALLVPRLLILIYIITNMGFGAWAIVHLIVTVCVYIGGNSYRSKSD